MTGKAEAVFRSKAPWIMVLIRRDFPVLDVDDAAAIVGNLGHESGGLASLQELAPTVKGSKGGYGWAAWTGARRRAYEAWCEREGLSPADDEANYRCLPDRPVQRDLVADLETFRHAAEFVVRWIIVHPDFRMPDQDGTGRQRRADKANPHNPHVPGLFTLARPARY